MKKGKRRMKELIWNQISMKRHALWQGKTGHESVAIEGFLYDTAAAWVEGKMTWQFWSVVSNLETRSG